MVDEKEQNSALFQPTGASSSTFSLPVQPPASKRQQNQNQNNPTFESSKRDAVDLTESRHQE